MGFRILHLSDTHVSATGPEENGIDAVSALERLLDDLRSVEDLDLVLVTGDVADDGSAAGCATVRERVTRFAAERGIPQAYSTGNHDSRDGFREALGHGHLTATGSLDPEVATGPDCAAVRTVSGVRVVTLDTLVPGRPEGRIPEAQLDWLREVLREPAPHGSVVALHHPPVWPSDSDFLAAIGLREPERLAEAIAGTDVRAVLCGHFHAQVSGSLAGVPVWVTPGVVSRIDLTAPRSRVRLLTGPAGSVVELTDAGSVLCHSVHAGAPPPEEVLFVDNPVPR